MTLSARSLRAALLVACAALGFAAAFGLVSSAGAQSTDPPTTTEPPPAEPPAEPAPPPTPAPIAFGVIVGGVKVGGMMPYQASKAVSKEYGRPLVLVADETTRLGLAASVLGAQANVPKAIRRARLARPGAVVPLDVKVSQARVRRYVDKIGKTLDREPVDARMDLSGPKPRAVEAEDGRILKKLATGRAIRTALATNSRAPIRLAFESQRPEVVELDKAVVILRGSNRLLYFDNAKLVRWFRVATGLPQFPTPLGNFEIVNLQRNPWWYPPPSPWAKDAKPVPPGPGNPLGTRWMGISAPYIGIHGTPDAASIGYSASHGCIRMRVPEAEWLFRRMEIGTPVFIVSR